MEFLTVALYRAAGLITSLDAELYNVVYLSLKVSIGALMVSSLTGVPCAMFLYRGRLRLKGVILTVLNTLMGLPPVVLGLFLYLLLSRRGPLGFMGLLYTPWAMLIAQAVLAFPIVTALAHAALFGVPKDIIYASRTLGASALRETLTVAYEARFGIVTGMITGLGRVTAEVGAVLMVGGNIAGHTRVMTTAIALETGRGEFELAMALGIILLLVSLTINFTLYAVRGKSTGYVIP